MSKNSNSCSFSHKSVGWLCSAGWRFCCMWCWLELRSSTTSQIAHSHGLSAMAGCWLWVWSTDEVVAKCLLVASSCGLGFLQHGGWVPGGVDPGRGSRMLNPEDWAWNEHISASSRLCWFNSSRAHCDSRKGKIKLQFFMREWLFILLLMLFTQLKRMHAYVGLWLRWGELRHGER